MANNIVPTLKERIARRRTSSPDENCCCVPTVFGKDAWYVRGSSIFQSEGDNVGNGVEGGEGYGIDAVLLDR